MDNVTKNWEQMTYPFFNIKLNYPLNALEPFIDTKTMQVHYEKLLANYIEKTQSNFRKPFRTTKYDFNRVNKLCQRKP